jgi:hypothetical protein
MSDNCDIHPVVRLPSGIAYPGIDCAGGGHFTEGKFKQ